MLYNTFINKHKEMTKTLLKFLTFIYEVRSLILLLLLLKKKFLKNTKKDKLLSPRQDRNLVENPPQTENDLSDSTDVGFAVSID